MGRQFLSPKGEFVRTFRGDICLSVSLLLFIILGKNVARLRDCPGCCVGGGVVGGRVYFGG